MLQGLSVDGKLNQSLLIDNKEDWNTIAAGPQAMMEQALKVVEVTKNSVKYDERSIELLGETYNQTVTLAESGQKMKAALDAMSNDQKRDLQALSEKFNDPNTSMVRKLVLNRQLKSQFKEYYTASKESEKAQKAYTKASDGLKKNLITMDE